MHRNVEGEERAGQERDTFVADDLRTLGALALEIHDHLVEESMMAEQPVAFGLRNRKRLADHDSGWGKGHSHMFHCCKAGYNGH
jgi:hypothetical protein